jgi:hypothetical protein
MNAKIGTARTKAAKRRWSCATAQMATRLPTYGTARYCASSYGSPEHHEADDQTENGILFGTHQDALETQIGRDSLGLRATGGQVPRLRAAMEL